MPTVASSLFRTRARTTSSGSRPPTPTCRPAQALDRDFRSINGPRWPLRTSEELLTAVYQYEVQAGLTLQSNVQFIRHPGGGTTDPLGMSPGKHLKNATVVGLRSVIKF
nr:carbohydrate porin [Bradyrhizobium japonicum]